MTSHIRITLLLVALPLAVLLLALNVGDAIAQDTDAPAEVASEPAPAKVVVVERPSEAIVTTHRAATMALEIVAIPLALLVALLLRRAIKWVAGKADIELSASQLALVDAGVTRAVGYGEQMARKAIKEHLDYQPNDKLRAAIDFGLDLAEKQGWPDWARDKLEELIEAKLGEKKLAAPAS